MSELFLEILNTGIMAGWLVLAVLIVRLPLKKAPAWVKCALWAIVGLRLVWPFEIESVLSLIPSTQTLPPTELYAPAPQVHTGVLVLNSAINPVFTPTFTPEPTNSVNPLQVATIIASWVWIMGMAVMALYTVFSYLRLRRLVRVSMPEGEGVYLCDHIASPFILGIVRPRIYLPSDLPREKWDGILAHERAHLARRDHWWKPLGFLLLTVFWFHPLLWLAYILLCRDVELACDEKVIASLSDQEKRDYSQVLLECSVERKWISACPLAFGETGVKQRIKAVLHYKKPTLWILIVALIACTVLAVCFLTEPTNESDADLADVAGKQYVYEGEREIIPFYINLYQDGTFQYFEGGYSSHIGMGKWELKNGKLYLYEERYAYSGTAGMHVVKDIFVFYVTDNALVYIADASANFLYVDVKDGERFYYAGELPAHSDVAGKSYFYEKSEFGWEFSINFHEDGTVTYSEGALSSHLGIGDWTLDGDLLCIEETRAFLSGLKVCTYYFKVTEDGLIFQADKSDSFIYVDLDDGALFYEYNPADHQSQRLLWVNVKEITEESIVAVDVDGNYWWFDLRYAKDGIIKEGHCWITYYEPETVAVGQFSDKYPVKYVAMAAKYWRYKDAPQGVYSDVLSTVYDYCYFDVDGDGDLEVCVLSDGRTSGIKSYSFTVWENIWENAECVYEQWLPDTKHSQAVAFEIVDGTLRVVTSAGTTYDVRNVDGEIHITQ